MPYFPATARYSLPYRAVAMREQRLALARAANTSDTNPVAPQPNQQPNVVAGVTPVSVTSSPKSIPAAPDAIQADFGAQGGDPSRGVEMDLSTCVNRYGPAPAALAALRAIEAAGVDVRVASAAVRDFHWSTHTRARMHSDNAWLGQALSGIPGLDPVINTNVHFQYAFCRRSKEVSAVFQRHGIGIRVLGTGHGVRPDALRIVAPRDDERERFAAAVADVVDERISL